MSKYKNVKFISLGLKNKYSEEYSSMTRDFLSAIQNYNKEISGGNLIYIDTPKDNYYGTDSSVNDKKCVSDKVPTNTYADVVYTNKIDNIKREQVFNIPVV